PQGDISPARAADRCDGGLRARRARAHVDDRDLGIRRRARALRALFLAAARCCSLHSVLGVDGARWPALGVDRGGVQRAARPRARLTLGGLPRSEEHTSELQSLTNLLCPLLLAK